jgi:hypothetical protein
MPPVAIGDLGGGGQRGHQNQTVHGESTLPRLEISATATSGRNGKIGKVESQTETVPKVQPSLE